MTSPAYSPSVYIDRYIERTNIRVRNPRVEDCQSYAAPGATTKRGAFCVDHPNKSPEPLASHSGDCGHGSNLGVQPVGPRLRWFVCTAVIVLAFPEPLTKAVVARLGAARRVSEDAVPNPPSVTPSQQAL